LNPRDVGQVEHYRSKLREIHDYSYELQRVEGADKVVRTPEA
jgi:hypothetical protein